MSSSIISSGTTASGAPVVAAWIIDDAEPLTETMDDDDFLASLEAYEHRGTRSRSSVSEAYIPPPLAAKMAALKGGPLPPVEPPKSPEQRAKEAWDKAAHEHKDLKVSHDAKPHQVIETLDSSEQHQLRMRATLAHSHR